MPPALARRTLVSMISGSPAWKPQATLAEEIRLINASSSPMRQGPKPSPKSAFKSIFITCPLCSFRCQAHERLAITDGGATLREHRRQTPSVLAAHWQQQLAHLQKCDQLAPLHQAAHGDQHFTVIGMGQSQVAQSRRLQQLLVRSLDGRRGGNAACIAAALEQQLHPRPAEV